MGYNLSGYKLKSNDTAQSVASIFNGDTDEEEYQGLAFTYEETNFIDRCLVDEYTFVKKISPAWTEYAKNSIQISITDDCMGIAVPYWKKKKSDIMLVYEIVAKITAHTEIIFWDPQVGDFLDNSTVVTEKVFEYGLSATNEIILSKTSPKAPWWQFWK